MAMVCAARADSTNAVTATPDPLATLKAGHPRLLLSEADWQTMRERVKHDPEFAKVVVRIETDAKWLLAQPPLTYKKEGKRLLDVSRQAVERILLWSITYHLTGDRVYADRAKTELLTLSAFPDWNPSHFLDVAEMTTAMALGYDWFYDELDDSSREIIVHAIVDHGLNPGLKAGSGNGSWHRLENNWNQVCFGGLTLGALAVGDKEPEPARALLNAAHAGIASGLKPYTPDGVYPEGPSYWGYGTVYQTLMISALRSALGTSWDLEHSPGFLASAAVQLQLTGPSEKYFNYFDCDEDPDLQAATFWFARELHDPGLLRYQWRSLALALQRSVESEPMYHENRLFGLIALWWSEPSATNAVSHLPLVWHGDGRNPVGVFRTSWTDTNAVYLAFKGGAAGLSHGHMDAGSFVLEADGVRWAIDLGRQDYLSLESKGMDIWSYAQNSKRWSVFRLNNFSHNTLTIGNQLHQVNGNAQIVNFHYLDAPHASATIDLSPVFAGQATNVTRQFQLDPDRTVSVHDVLAGVAPGTEVRWAMVTRADVTLDGNRATLKQDGKELNATLLSPTNGVFSVIPASPPQENDFDAPNPNTRILVVKVAAPETGEIKLEVSLKPGPAH